MVTSEAAEVLVQIHIEMKHNKDKMTEMFYAVHQENIEWELKNFTT